ncbi:pyruvate kinase [Rhodothermus marinus SG0.5JP17-172]|uniref:pyruvate kinase n=1 Tax=Rhodothermus marinus TaxID=29549 RepID=UPI000223DC86|nr:pyruvate kinase [Rhodothermus marinus]AEN73952.1 pyruvate kinase [Rhodothermus marinus SG0.5JP17-172]MBO2492409.1 pyruvate kinase [Rhodothermus marinus]
MTRRTKIVCTLGPASSDRETIRKLIEAGMDVARLNFSHGNHEEHRRRIEIVREEARKLGRDVAILQDLQGPKIRLGEVAEGGILIHEGQRLVLTAHPERADGQTRIFVNYPTLAQDVEPGGRILLDDGLLELKIVDVEGEDVITEVVVGGPLRSRKGVNLPHLRNSTPSLTEKDLRDLEFGLQMEVDLIALSFVRSETDVADLMRRVRDSGKEVRVIAKIEKPEAVAKIDQILAQADGIMVARGDLGIEMPLAEVPAVQKRIIRKCLAAAKPVITATQMLESMIENPRPTRAEASDVANAVLDGSDALMLSGETATGKYPVRVVQVMDEIIRQAERFRREIRESRGHGLHIPKGADEAESVTEAIGYTACQLAEQVGAVAIACLTATGSTARMIARHRPPVPVYAFTDNPRVVPQLSLLWGTRAFSIPFQRDTDQGVQLVHRILKEQGLVRPGDLVVITAGMPLPAKGRTNMVHVSRIE